MTRGERRYERDGIAVIEQPGDGPLVVFVHGVMDRASSFGRVARKLPGHHLLRYDRRGYGGSGPGTGFGLEDHVKDLLALVGSRPTVLFGHSLGGTIALAAALTDPRNILSLALYESPVPSVAPATTFEALPGEAPGDTAERFMVSMVGERIWSRLPARTREARRSEGPALLRDLESIRNDAVGLDAGAVEVPVLVAVGEASGTGAIRRGERLAAALPDATFRMVPGARHGVHLSDPTATADLVVQAVSVSERRA